MKTPNAYHPVNTQTAGYLVIFGILLILLGVAGYLSHPEKAYTALIFGGVFGALWILCGILGAKGIRGSRVAALAAVGLVALTCVWRATLGWLAVANGQSEKVFAALVITLMFAVSASMLSVLLKGRRMVGAEKQAGGLQ